jgi:hydrogenase-4 membrane subunit HyfE
VSDALVTPILLLGIAVIVPQRRTVAIGLVAAQSLALSIVAFELAGGRSSDYLVASFVLLCKAVALPALLYALIRRTQERRPVVAAAGPLTRAVATGAAALLAAALMPSLDIAGAHVERVAVALVVTGIAIVVARRPAFFQLLGLIVAENGLALLAIFVPGGLSYVVELGALFDLVLVVTVASAFVSRIHAELGTGNTELLRGLRD